MQGSIHIQFHLHHLESPKRSDFRLRWASQSSRVTFSCAVALKGWLSKGFKGVIRVVRLCLLLVGICVHVRVRVRVRVYVDGRNQNDGQSFPDCCCFHVRHLLQSQTASLCERVICEVHYSFVLAFLGTSRAIGY